MSWEETCKVSSVCSCGQGTIEQSSYMDDWNNEELNLLRFIEGIHDYRYEFDTGLKIYKDDSELNHMFAGKADFDNLYNAIKLNENGIKTGITKNNYFEFVHRKGLVNSITKQDLYFSMLPDVGFDIPDYDKCIE